MNRNFSINRFFIYLLFSSATWTQTIIAVFEFENNGLDPREVRQLSTRLESEMVKLGDFKVVERAKIDDILKEQKLQISGSVEETLVDVGKLLGANQIILGSIGKIGDVFTLSAKLVDVESGELLTSSDFDAKKGLSEFLGEGLKNVALELTGVSLEMQKYKNFESIIHSAETEAEKQYDDQLFKYAGIGSCVSGFGVPLSFVMLNIKPPYYTNFDKSNPKYMQLENNEEQEIYKDAYYERENRLRRRSVHKAQGMCLAFYIILVVLTAEIEAK